MAFKKMQEEGRLHSCLIFTHRTTIKDQWINSSSLLGINLLDWESITDQDSLAFRADGLVTTYQAVSREPNSFINKLFAIFSGDLIAIADEAHHLGVDPDELEGPVWGKHFLDLTRNCKLRLGLTGTPFRADNLAFCSARRVRVPGISGVVEQITPDLCVEPRELIQTGDVRPLEFHFQDGWVEHFREDSSEGDLSSISNEQRENWRARNLRSAIKLSDPGSIALQLLLRARSQLDKVRCSHSNAAGIVIAKDIEHAEAIANLLREQGDKVDLVHSQHADAADKLKMFDSGTSDWLVSVDMCSEGFDAPRLRVVAYLTTVVTKSRFIQGITRAVRISSDRTSLETIPRNPSFVFAPADPLLIEFAKSWSISNPYLIPSKRDEDEIEVTFGKSYGLTLPLEALNVGVGPMIRLGTAELPSFL